MLDNRKKQKNWCSKHQRVHQERKHQSCRYPNDKKSKCCNANVKMVGATNPIVCYNKVTCYYICCRCGKECEIK